MKYTTKEEIKTWLDTYHIMSYTIKDDLSIVCSAGVKINGSDIKVLPVNFSIVGEGFEMTNGVLESLDGFPRFVHGNVDVSGNQLINLEHAPKTINGNFNCSNNKINSLKGMGKVFGTFQINNNLLQTLEGFGEVKGHIEIRQNHLKSLKGAPVIVYGNFMCDENQLESLLYAPRTIEGDFLCDDNQLKDFNHGPKHVTGSYCAQNNQLISLYGLPEKLGDDLFINNNALENLLYCPKLLQRIYAKNNPLNSFEYLPEKFVGISFSRFTDDFSIKNNCYQQHNKGVITLSQEEMLNTWHEYKKVKLYEKMQVELHDHTNIKKLKI